MHFPRRPYGLDRLASLVEAPATAVVADLNTGDRTVTDGDAPARYPYRATAEPRPPGKWVSARRNIGVREGRVQSCWSPERVIVRL